MRTQRKEEEGRTWAITQLAQDRGGRLEPVAPGAAPVSARPPALPRDGLLLWVPVINVLAWIALNFALARRFGRSPLFALGLCFVNPIFMPVLALGSSRYRLAG